MRLDRSGIQDEKSSFLGINKKPSPNFLLGFSIDPIKMFEGFLVATERLYKSPLVRPSVRPWGRPSVRRSGRRSGHPSVMLSLFGLLQPYSRPCLGKNPRIMH